MTNPNRGSHLFAAGILLFAVVVGIIATVLVHMALVDVTGGLTIFSLVISTMALAVTYGNHRKFRKAQKIQERIAAEDAAQLRARLAQSRIVDE